MIRKITNNDRELYCAMASEFYSTDAVLFNIPKKNIEATFEEMMRSEQYAIGYILEHEGETAGYALLAKTFSQEAGGLVIWIEELYVLPAFRSKGLGQEFFRFLEETNKADIARIRLEVEDENEGAIALYERMGFERLEYSQMIKPISR